MYSAKSCTIEIIISAHTHKHTDIRTHGHTDYTKLNFYTQIKTGSQHRLEPYEHSITERKTEQVYSFRKINVSRFDLKEDPNTSKIQKNAYLLGHKLTFEQINKPYHALINKRSFEPFMCLDLVLDR